MSNDKLTLRYVPLADAVLWDRNPKEHDIGALCESIRRYGFQDPPKYDASLGAIVYGNGRIMALQMMHRAGDPTPRGVIEGKDDNWLVPIKFGVDLPDRQTAEAFALDHNNVTMAGGDFSSLDMLRMWDQDAYLDLLSEIAQNSNVEPVTITDEDLDDMLRVLQSLPEPGSAETLDTPGAWLVIVECEDEQKQVEVIEYLSEGGYECRALVS